MAPSIMPGWQSETRIAWRIAVFILATAILAVGRESPAPPFPWDVGKEYRFHWLSKGVQIGQTKFRILREEKEGKTRYRVVAHVDILRPGLELHTDFESILDESLRPVSMTRRMKTGTGVYRTTLKTEATFKEKSVHVETQHGKGDPAALDFPASGFYYLYSNWETHAWGIFLGRAPLHAVSRFQIRVCFLDLSRVLPVDLIRAGKETLRGKECLHIRCKLPVGECDIWVAKDGRMIEYRDRDYTFRLVE